MTRRKKGPVKRAKQAPRAKSKPVSDVSKLMWLELMTPASALEVEVRNRLLQIQAAVVKRMAELDGIDLAQGWVYNADLSRWEMPNGPVG